MALIRKAHSARKYGHSWINVSSKGIIRLSQRLVLSLGVKHGDYVAFYQDDIRTKDWYIRKENDGLRINKSNINNFKINSKVIAQDILSSIKTNRTVKIRVSTIQDDNGMFALLTSSAIDMQGNKITTF